MILTRRTLLALSAGLAAFGGGLRPGAAAAPLRVVATTGMIGDAVRQVAGGRAEVTALMGEGVDPHLYRATRSDIARMLEAELVFYNGLLLEGKMTDALVRVARAGKPVFAVTELIDESWLLAPPGFQGHFDPHVWMDPRAWAKAVEVVRDRLAEVDPASGEAYRANAASYLQPTCSAWPSSTLTPSACWRRCRPGGGRSSPPTTPSTISAAATASR
jgi:manganese/zinc/iron transport system substrate-binding protein